MCAQQVSRWLILTGHGVNRHDHFNVNYLKAELHQTGSTPLTSSQINSLQNIRRVSLSSDLGDVNQCLTELRGIWEHQTIEAEGHLQVMTWYADTERWPRCPEARAVQLPSDLSQWMTRLIEAWDDRADPDEVFHLHMIQPQPQTTFWEDHPAPHVLVIQQPMPDRRSLHFTAFQHRKIYLPTFAIR